MLNLYFVLFVNVLTSKFMCLCSDWSISFSHGKIQKITRTAVNGITFVSQLKTTINLFLYVEVICKNKIWK